MQTRPPTPSGSNGLWPCSGATKPEQPRRRTLRPRHEVRARRVTRSLRPRELPTRGGFALGDGCISTSGRLRRRHHRLRCAPKWSRHPRGESGRDPGCGDRLGYREKRDGLRRTSRRRSRGDNGRVVCTQPSLKRQSLGAYRVRSRSPASARVSPTWRSSNHRTAKGSTVRRSQ